MCVPQESSSSVNELYFRGKCVCDSDVINIPSGNRITFDTYFNLFSVRTWEKYTNAENIKVEIDLVGDGVATLYGFDRENREYTNVASVSFSSDKPCALTLLNKTIIKQLPDYLFVDVSSVKESVSISDIRYLCDSEILDDISLACCFCTFKREVELKKNVDQLTNNIVLNPNSELYEKLDIYIADNGNTLSLDMFDETDHIYLFGNKNYGGSAGFTRCIIESVFRTKQKKFSHIILMDDDALILPHVVERTFNLLRVLKPEMKGKMIGGAMLDLGRQTIQLENGAYVNPKSWRVKIGGASKDLSNIDDVVNNEFSFEPNYNGWFYCCIPVSYINENNLPLPMFLHADDQEYGYRNRSGFITMNGICIWHPNTWAKKRAYIEYYDARNAFIALSKSNPEMSSFMMCVRISSKILRLIYNYQYDEAEYVLKAYDDYFKGPQWLSSIDPEKLNGEILNWKKAKKCVLETDRLNKILKNPSNEHSNKKALKVLNMFLPAFKKEIAYNENYKWSCYLPFCAKNMYIVNVNTGEGFVITKSYKRFFSILWKLVCKCFYVIFHYKKIHDPWVEKIHDFETLTYWERVLSL